VRYWLKITVTEKRNLRLEEEEPSSSSSPAAAADDNNNNKLFVFNVLAQQQKCQLRSQQKY
jgi:hypothetical protein